jgi:enoyl-CoA hydratase/carnithine racemase
MERDGRLHYDVGADGLAELRLNHPRGNAIGGSMVEGLRRAFRDAEGDPAVRGVLLASDGRLFSPGLDLVELAALDRGSMSEFMTRFSACVLQMYTFPKPVVAALRGPALAGGLVLALTADWRVLADGARVGLNELRVGVPLPFGVSMILREAVAGPRLEEAALFGRNYLGAEAVEVGLVHEVRPADDVDSAGRERLVEMTSKDARAFAITKKYLRSATVERFRAFDAQCLGEFLDGWFSPETRLRIEGLVAELRAKHAG